MTQPPNQPGPEGQNDWTGPQPQGTPNPQGPPQPQGTPNPGYGQQPQDAPNAGYGQQPQGGYDQQPQQGGYDQQPQSFEQQAAFGAAGGPQAFPEKKSGFQKVKSVLGIIVAVVLVAVVGWGLWSNYQSDAALEAGNCLVFSGESDDADHDLVDCEDSTTFSYLVAKVIEGDGSCGADFVEYTVGTESRTGSTSTDKVTCLIENFHAGNCYAETGDIMTFGIVECSDPSASFKISTVEDSADATCAAEEQPYSFTEPARTYCMADPAA